MKFLDWLRPGLRVKRWVLMGLLGLTVFVLGISRVLMRGITDSLSLLYFYFIFLGIVIMYYAIRLGLKSMMNLVSGTNVNYKDQSITNMLYEQRLLTRGPRIVAIGGGTGLSTMLRGLKDYTSNISAIVTVADDGGGSGVLRETLGILPPGDIRNCVLALAHTEPVMEELLQYRFKEGDLKGQSFGNLFIAAMNGISKNFEEAIKKMSDVLAVVGRVYPVTLDNVNLKAELENGEIVKGESHIPEVAREEKSKIKKIFLEPANVTPLQDALFEIDAADCIIMGPGSLYTSILPNLVIKEVAERVAKSNALKIYISNIMTQPGETDGYRLSDHIMAIERHCGSNMIDFVVANDGVIPEPFYDKYKSDGQEIVQIDKENLPRHMEVVSDDFVLIKNGHLRHNTKKLASTIMELVLKFGIPKTGKRILDYYYLSERIKEMKRR